MLTVPVTCPLEPVWFDDAMTKELGLADASGGPSVTDSWTGIPDSAFWLLSMAVAVATTSLLPELSMLNALRLSVRRAACGLLGDEFWTMLKVTDCEIAPELTVNVTGRTVASLPCVRVAVSTPVVASVVLPAGVTTAPALMVKPTGTPPTAARLASTDVTVAVIESDPEFVIVFLLSTTTRSAAVPVGPEAPLPGPTMGVPALPPPPPQAVRAALSKPPKSICAARQLQTSNFVISVRSHAPQMRGRHIVNKGLFSAPSPAH